MLSATVQCEVDADNHENATEEDTSGENYTILYLIDEEDRIILVNNNWLDFAQENGGAALAADYVLHKPLWAFIDDPETQLLYRSILDKVRARQRVKLHMRCDAPECRRRIILEISMLTDEIVQFRSTTVRREERAYVPLLDSSLDRAEDFLTICGWCKRIKISEQLWLEVEEAVNHLNLFDKPNLPHLTHGICRDCYQAVDAVIS